jgi:4-diphosphocytidyl-2-C-methyl-D-erythritol kinase
LPARIRYPAWPRSRSWRARAAQALREASGTRLGADIAIDKPHSLGGGLGGGQLGRGRRRWSR